MDPTVQRLAEHRSPSEWPAGRILAETQGAKVRAR